MKLIAQKSLTNRDNFMSKSEISSGMPEDNRADIQNKYDSLKPYLTELIKYNEFPDLKDSYKTRVMRDRIIDEVKFISKEVKRLNNALLK